MNHHVAVVEFRDPSSHSIVFRTFLWAGAFHPSYFVEALTGTRNELNRKSIRHER